MIKFQITLKRTVADRIVDRYKEFVVSTEKKLMPYTIIYFSLPESMIGDLMEHVSQVSYDFGKGFIA